MLDQGTRTAFRGTPKAFAYDDIAKELVLEIVEKGWFFEKYLPIERQVLCLPLVHSEDIHAHRVTSELVHRLSEGTENPELVEMFKSNVGFLAEHTEVVEKFGRYPSRNSALVSSCIQFVTCAIIYISTISLNSCNCSPRFCSSILFLR